MAVPGSVLVVAARQALGHPELGESYEWMHVYEGIRSTFEKVEAFDFMGASANTGREGMQASLMERICEMQPDVVVFALVADEFDAEWIDSVRSRTRTLCFFVDDSWRHSFVRFWAPHFDAFTTVLPRGERLYADEGLPNAIHLPFGVNEALFRPAPDTEKEYDVTFVGGWHPYRQWFLEKVQKLSGITISTFGPGWPAGGLDTHSLIRVLSTSRLSLNVSNSQSWDLRYVASSVRALSSVLRSPKTGEQIKGRHFEIPACGALQLTHYVEGLASFYDLENEVVVYLSPEDLASKLRYHLDHQDEAAAMALAATRRTLSEHTYGSRFAGALARLRWLPCR